MVPLFGGYTFVDECWPCEWAAASTSDNNIILKAAESKLEGQNLVPASCSRKGWQTLQDN